LNVDKKESFANQNSMSGGTEKESFHYFNNQGTNHDLLKMPPDIIEARNHSLSRRAAPAIDRDNH
jgi:hypothetical protein